MGIILVSFLVVADDKDTLLARLSTDMPAAWERTLQTLGRASFKGYVTIEAARRPTGRVDLDVSVDVPRTLHRIKKVKNGRPEEWMVLNPRYRFQAMRSAANGPFRVDDVALFVSRRESLSPFESFYSEGLLGSCGMYAGDPTFFTKNANIRFVDAKQDALTGSATYVGRYSGPRVGVFLTDTEFSLEVEPMSSWRVRSVEVKGVDPPIFNRTTYTYADQPWQGVPRPRTRAIRSGRSDKPNDDQTQTYHFESIAEMGVPDDEFYLPFYGVSESIIEGVERASRRKSWFLPVAGAVVAGIALIVAGGLILRWRRTN